jgi:hypothetical protein
MRNPVALALASLAALGSTTVAHAGVQTNGPLLNGAQINGAQINGAQINGAQINGAQINGAQINGTSISVSVVGFQSTCPHREDVTGAAMPGTCSPCAQAVVNSDPYCATNSWDYYCVNGWGTSHQGTKGYCTLDSTELVGQKFKVTFPDSGWAQVRLDRVDRGSTATWNGNQYLNMSDVYYHTLSYTCSHAATVQGAPLQAACSSTATSVCASDSYCCNNYWDSLCVAEANSWAGANKAAKGAVGGVCTAGGGRGLFVAGKWDQTYIGQYRGAGGKTSWSNTTFTFSCETNGAIGKCVNFGYKPWASSTQDTLHQTCVRMVRNDVCGDGTPWTADGTQIFVEDWQGIQDGDFCWSFLESSWNTMGGCPYYMPWRSTYSGMSYSSYRSTHSYCPDPNGVHPECTPDLNSTTRLMWDALWVPCEG